MPNLNWSQINHLQLGKIAELYAQAEFLSYGYEVYDTIVDDRGIDFLTRKDGAVFEVQVKAVRNYNYTFMTESKMPELTEKRLVCFLHFEDGEQPEIYVIPAKAWDGSNSVLVKKDYEKIEYGIQFSRKNKHMLEEYISKNVLSEEGVR